jgi:hypothetical protein
MNKFEALQLLMAELKKLPQSIIAWAKSDAKYWGIAFGSMITFLIALDLLIGTNLTKKVLAEVVYFDTEVDTAIEETPITRFEVGDTPIEPTVLNTETLTMEPPAIEQEAQFNDSSADFTEAGGGSTSAQSASFTGLGGFDVNVIGTGPAVKGLGGVGGAPGESNKSGRDGAGESLGGRGQGSRQAMLSSGGGTQDSERAVAGAINWLARHQNTDGSWSCKNYTKQCTDTGHTCTGHEVAGDYPMAATAFGLLPFFAAGQTHETKGPVQRTIRNGLMWMIKNQDQKTGKLGTGTMYEHGLGTIALSEAYGLSKDNFLKVPAQMAVKFIEEAQNQKTGGWHYAPLGEGDTSVVGWQLMGLKSAQMAGLQVSPKTLDKAKVWLKSVSKGKAGGLFSYMPPSGPTPCMTAVGLLCSQYSGAKRTDPLMIEGMNYVMSNLPASAKDSYYWYYATQVMHNLPGPEWDTWNRHARRLLISTQVKEGCAAGSWDPSGDGSAVAGGRVMVTSIRALTLEVYYRYLPLYQLNKSE